MAMLLLSTQLMNESIAVYCLTQQPYIAFANERTPLRMPAPVLFSIVGDVPLLRLLRRSDMSDVNVEDGWGIYTAVTYCLGKKQLHFCPAMKFSIIKHAYVCVKGVDELRFNAELFAIQMMVLRQL